MTWLLVGWLGFQLEWQPTEGKALSNSELIWRFRNNGKAIKVLARRLPEGEPLLYRLSLDWSDSGEERKTHFERLDNERIGIVETRSTATPRVFSAFIPKRSALVSAQLAHRERDKIFENALRLSNAMTELFQK